MAFDCGVFRYRFHCSGRIPTIPEGSENGTRHGACGVVCYLFSALAKEYDGDRKEMGMMARGGGHGTRKSKKQMSTEVKEREPTI